MRVRGDGLRRHPPLADHAGQHADRLVVAEHVDVDHVRSGHPGQPGAAGRQHHAVPAARQQRCHLRLGRRVVEQDQHPFARQAVAEHLRALVGVFRDRLAWHAHRPQKPAERVHRPGRLVALPAEIAVQLAVREVGVADAVCDVDGQRALADAGFAQQHHYLGGVGATAEQLPFGTRDEFGTAGEIGDVGGELERYRRFGLFPRRRRGLGAGSFAGHRAGQDRGLQPAQLLTGLEPELVDHQFAAQPVGFQRLGLPAGSEQSQHELAP